MYAICSYVTTGIWQSNQDSHSQCSELQGQGEAACTHIFSPMQSLARVCHYLGNTIQELSDYTNFRLSLRCCHM